MPPVTCHVSCVSCHMSHTTIAFPFCCKVFINIRYIENLFKKKIFILQREGKTSPLSPPCPFLDIQADRFNGVNNPSNYQWVSKILIIWHHRFPLYYLTVVVVLRTDRSLLEWFLKKTQLHGLWKRSKNMAKSNKTLNYPNPLADSEASTIIPIKCLRSCFIVIFSSP